MNRILAAALLLVVAIVSVTGGVAAASAATTAPASAGLAAAPPSLDDRPALAAFLDGVTHQAMTTGQTAGVTVAVVKDGHVLLSRGYGYADVAADRPVDPQTTLFRIASISKVFTWIAAMQLAEQGRIDLNADVNRYLDFRIPATFARPITMKDLMANTAGFEDRSFGYGAATAADLIPLGRFLRTHLPARVRPPGVLPAYSNYSTGLGGYIVQRVSGEPYETYIERHILEPLGMTHTTVRQPLPANLRADMSQGYTFAQGAFEPQPFELFNNAPDGAISSTASDMARLMLAILQDGQLGVARILTPQSALAMQQVLYAPSLQVNGWLYGYRQMDRNGQRVYGHGGDSLYFHSEMALLPDRHVGIFVASNSEGAVSAVPVDVYNALMDRYYPTAGAPVAIAGAKRDAARYAGFYQTTRRSYTTAEKATGIFGATGITALSDGSLVAAGKRYVETAPGLYTQVGGDGRDTDLYFASVAGGAYPVAFLRGNAFERLRWYETPRVSMLLVVVCFALFLSAAVVAVRAALKRRSGGKDARPSRPAAAARWLQAALFVALVLFVSSLVIAAGSAGWADGQTSPSFLAVGGLAIAMAVLVAGAVASSVAAWVRGYWRLPGRIHYTVVTVAGVALVWFVIYWNLLGWKY